MTPKTKTPQDISAYFPDPGDVIVFPGAPLAVNRTRRYVATGHASGQVMFTAEDGGAGYGTFCHPIGKLWEIGMTRVTANPSSLLAAKDGDN